MAVQAVLEEYICSDLSNVIIDYMPEFELINHKIIDFGTYQNKHTETLTLILDNNIRVYISLDGAHDETWFAESVSRGDEYIYNDRDLLGAEIINIVNIPYNIHQPESGNADFTDAGYGLCGLRERFQGLGGGSPGSCVPSREQDPRLCSLWHGQHVHLGATEDE